MRIVTGLIGLCLLGACSGSIRTSEQTLVLPEGGETVITFASTRPLMVSFGFELGSPSWDATDACPEKNAGDVTDPFMLRICGGLYDENADHLDWGTYFEGLHGGGVAFEPTDGKIRVRLKNHARQTMAFIVSAEPV